MKKTLKVLFLVILLILCMACKLPEREEESSFELPLDKLRQETTTGEEETTSVWVKPEMATVPSVIPNSVGIMIREEYEEEETTIREIPKEDRQIKVSDSGSYSAEEDAARLGVSKILTFYTESRLINNLDTDIIKRFNELLVTKYGCDFVVSFYGGYVNTNEAGYTYYHAVSDAKSKGQQADILITSEPAYYSRLVEEGFFVDISEYLTATEDGKKLYEAYPKEVWDKIELDGRIYGYMPVASPADSYVLVCNKVMAERFGLDVEEGFSFYEIGDIFKKAGFSGEKTGGEMPVYANWVSLYNILGYYDMGRGVFAKKDTEGKWIAFNATEDAEFIRLCKTIREYKDKGWLRNMYFAENAMMEGEFIFAITSCEGADIDIENSRITYNYQKKSVERDVIFGEIYHSWYDAGESSVYGITAWSQYKEEALKLMMLLSTEEELANLLVYGVENEHYTYVDDKLMQLYSSSGYGMELGIVNPNLLSAQELGKENTLDFYKAWSNNYEASPFAEYDISFYDYEQLEKKYDYDKVLYQLYYEGCIELLLGVFEDVDEAISEINRMQKAEGIDAFIAAINAEFARHRD